MLKLVPPSPSPSCPEVVDMLEDMLTRAKAGEVVSVAVIGITKRGEALRFWALNDHAIELIGGVAIMQQRLCAILNTEPVEAPTDPAS